MAAVSRDITWIHGPNGKIVEYGQADLVSGTVSFNSALRLVKSAVATFAGTTQPGTATLYINQEPATDGAISTSGVIKIACTDLSSTAGIMFIAIGIDRRRRIGTMAGTPWNGIPGCTLPPLPWFAPDPHPQ